MIHQETVERLRDEIAAALLGETGSSWEVSINEDDGSYGYEIKVSYGKLKMHRTISIQEMTEYQKMIKMSFVESLTIDAIRDVISSLSKTKGATAER